MARFLKSREKIVGQAPGTMTFIGRQKMAKTRFRLMTYNEGEIEVFEEENAKDLFAHFKPENVNWINIDGVHDQNAIMEIGNEFGLTPLVLEDIVNTDQRPKVIEDDNNLVVFLKQLAYVPEDECIHAEQITLVLGKNYVLTFQEKTGSTFDPIRERMLQNIGKVRSSKSDYLFYRFIDTIVDNYMVSIGIIGDLVEGNEEYVLSNVNKEFVEEIFSHKTEISYIRKAIRPAKEVTKKLKNTETELIKETTWPYIEDLDDLLVHALESVEMYYTMISDQLNIYNTNQSNRANDVMKVLTIFAAIFIPLTFIAGIYGTNFDNVPELHYQYSYFIMLGLMLTLAIIMLIYFRRKKWL
ncbi:MAG: magnesium/cobalt transporter CorA [Prolixibacteraceae bacterium]